MSLFDAVNVDEATVKSLLTEHFPDLELLTTIKKSQNHTYLAKERRSDTKFIVRATPDNTGGTRIPFMETESKFLQFLDEKGLSVCPPLCSWKTGDVIISHRSPKPAGDDNLILLSVFRYARGEPVDIFSWKWMTEKEYAVRLGRWLGQFHTLSREFTRLHPAVPLRSWRDLHQGIFRDIVMDPRDEATAADPTYFGLIHGDVNISNFFDSPDLGVCMFDWDQAQGSWFLYDLSSPIWTVISFQKGGNPIDKSIPVPAQDANVYAEWILEGYEHPVNREALQRMVTLRRQLYVLFCNRAMKELAEDHPMYSFCAHMASWLNKES